MKKIKSIIPESEREFLELRGDGTEMVKVNSCSRDFCGWYLFLKYEGKNKFLRQGHSSRGTEGLVETLSCETCYIQFDKDGMHLNHLYENYEPIGSQRQKYTYSILINYLREAGEWKEGVIII